MGITEEEARRASPWFLMALAERHWLAEEMQHFRTAQLMAAMLAPWHDSKSGPIRPETLMPYPRLLARSKRQAAKSKKEKRYGAKKRRPPDSGS